jgi:hypothetical protein
MGGAGGAGVKFLAGNGLLALVVVSTAFGAMPDASSYVTDVEAGRDPARFDFGKAGFWELGQSQRKEWNWALMRKFSDPGKTTGTASPSVLDPTASCEPGAQRRLAAMAWASLAVQADDENHWRAANAELVAKMAKLDATLDESAAKLEAGSDPRIAELQRRFARDQAIRNTMVEPDWTAGLSELASKSWFLVRAVRWTAIDCDNTRWLRLQMGQIGWFDIRKFGADADTAAWHLVQHADRDVDFQRSTLEMLQKLPKEATDQKRLAYLYDRVALADGRPQRFATQRSCLADGGSEVRSLEDPARLDQRRVEAGLEPTNAAPVAKDPNCPQPGN